MKGLAIGVLAVTITCSCVTTRTTPAGQAVRITSNPEIVRGCAFLGEVVGKDRMNGGLLGQGAAEENATRRVKNTAAEMGADTVLISTSTTGFSGSTIRGEAYRCKGK